MAQRRRDWDKVIERLNRSRKGQMSIRMGSPGSAQVTRTRLLRDYRHLDAETKGATLYLRVRR